MSYTPDKARAAAMELTLAAIGKIDMSSALKRNVHCGAKGRSRRKFREQSLQRNLGQFGEEAMTFVAKNLPAEPGNEGWVTGWGVFRNAPWLLAAVLASKADAEEEAAKLPEDFQVKYGSHRLGSDDFVFSSQDNE